MKLPELKFDRSFLPLILAFLLGLAASSSGCTESNSDSVSVKQPTTIGRQNEVTRHAEIENRRFSKFLVGPITVAHQKTVSGFLLALFVKSDASAKRVSCNQVFEILMNRLLQLLKF